MEFCRYLLKPCLLCVLFMLLTFVVDGEASHSLCGWWRKGLGLAFCVRAGFYLREIVHLYLGFICCLGFEITVFIAGVAAATVDGNRPMRR